MDWLKAKTVADLKHIGKMNEIKRTISAALGTSIKVTPRNWEELMSAVKSLNNFVSLATGNYPKEKSESKNILYFQSEADQLIFYLLELEGEVRLKKLKIRPYHFHDKELATEWRNKIIKLIHPDICNHPLAGEAVAEMNKLFERMAGKNEKKQTLNSTS
jgi:hypothetical protein